MEQKSKGTDTKTSSKAAVRQI